MRRLLRGVAKIPLGVITWWRFVPVGGRQTERHCTSFCFRFEHSVALLA